ncbi:AAA family ATPase [Candidatus Sulfurimonas baltica]|uniref:AAA family ATPase n=1 Tax=Candidatus Sulfurimonas baltica TaxID=2740404 RepID=A0A7S7RMX1_9BACT|nr:AAA family ATPase [Candidatus Sulfurimonas baltica]QOY51929.1 AAA family ATPase [Candidatus Sulfurimonas baltica]
MELVYLWVEDYKNIHHQGFNFSPRFECKFDGENLTIDDKSKDYVSIFPDNINITAIVGENGSGKSSLFEIISKILTVSYFVDELNFFYVLNNGIDNICYSGNINVINPDIHIEKHISFVHSKEGTNEHNPKVNLKHHFDVYYLNISHLEREGIIENDSPSPEDPIKYYGIYRKNDFNLYKENSLYPTFSGFKLSQFNFFQTYAIGNLLVDDKYKKLFFEVFKIKQPYSIKIDYTEKKLEEIKISNTPDGDLSRAIDESVPDKIDKIINFLIKIDNNLIIESDDYKTFFTLVSSANLAEEFQLTFQTEENKTIKLSAGEKTILFYLERIDFMLSQFKSKSNIVLFDEIELYLHPNWQKRILKIILDFIQENELVENLHIIIASHSPFILSDLPKENVIFLDKFDDETKKKYPKLKINGLENGNCINVSKYIELNPFGANIHTLLSDGFFMKDGLMGEFAKEKINEIKEFYDKVKKSKNPQKTYLKKYNENKKDFENIQRIIGEPFLKTIMKNYLDELEILFHGKKEFLDKEIKRLEKLRESLDDKA